MEMEDVDEFASSTSSDHTEPVPLDIKSRGIIVSTMFEAGDAKTRAERDTLLTLDYGDLPLEKRAERREQESVWTVSKKSIFQNWFEPPVLVVEGKFKTPEERKVKLEEKRLDFIVLGSNNVSCYALETPPGVGSKHKKLLNRLECKSLVKNFKHNIANFELKKQATDMLDHVMAIAKHDESLRPTIKAVGKHLSDKIKTLPEHLPVGKSPKLIMEADRPGKTYPGVEILFMEYANVPTPTTPEGVEKGDEFFIWTIHTNLNSSHWVKSRTTIIVKPNTVPGVAFNNTHLVVLYQPLYFSNEDIICLDLYKLTAIGRVPKAHCDRFYFTFPESFSTHGILSVTLSELGICTIAYSIGCVVIDVLRQVVRPRAVILTTPDVKHRRMVTTAIVNHLPDEKRPSMEEGDHWDETLSDVLETGTRVPVPAWSGTLSIGTDAGEAIGICWRSSQLVFAEVIPAVEPIFGCIYSNKRVLMHSIMEISGKMLPFVTEKITHLPTSRPLHMAVCGTLIFVLEKYGSIQIFSTTVRKILFSFKPPKSEFTFAPSEPKQHCYPAIYAGPERVVVVYPNMLVRVLGIRKKEESIPSNKVKTKKNKK